MIIRRGDDVVLNYSHVEKTRASMNLTRTNNTTYYKHKQNNCKNVLLIQDVLQQNEITSDVIYGNNLKNLASTYLCIG